MDFYLWGGLKDIVSTTRTTRRENALRILRAEIETAVLSTLQRINACVDSDGRQLEHLGHH